MMPDNTVPNQPSIEYLSKKEIVEKVRMNIAKSLAEFRLSGKKYEEKLEKATKLFAKGIVKGKKKKKK